MKRYSGYLIDLDGTMYRGTECIAEAREFVNELHRRGIPYLFVTNNSSRTPAQVAEKLRTFGVPAEEKHVLRPARRQRTTFLSETRTRLFT